MPSDAYRDRLTAEEHFYGSCTNVHDLPGICYYWSHNHLRPLMEPFGFRNESEFFAKYLIERCVEQRPGADRIKRFASIGCGNGELEIDLALRLRSAGHSRFVIDCLDLNEEMLERGRLAANVGAVHEQVNFLQADLNRWKPAHEYDAIVANQFLHHVVNLEDLLAATKNCLQPDGCFLISDMIGRNGHQRWPEALEIVREFWRQLPPSYRYNRSLRRYEEIFSNWDCSVVGFEGIRCQDILPLLIAQFHFRFFFGFGNVIDPFVDRSFGHNFNAEAPWDRAFIDRVHERDERELFAGRIKPTHLLAVVGKSAGPLTIRGGMTPEFCVRKPEEVHDAPATETSPYEWNSWPHSAEEEIAIACRRLAESEVRIAGLERELRKEQEKITELKHRPWRSLARVLSHSK